MTASCLHIVLAMLAQNKAATNYIVIVFIEISCVLLPKYLQEKTDTEQFPLAC